MTPRAETGTVAVRLGADRTVVVFSGDIDITLEPEITAAIRYVRVTGLPLELDVRHVTFIDSTGLVGLARLAMTGPGRATLLHPPPVVDFVLDMTELGRHFSILR